MAITDFSIYRRRADIVAEMLATLVAAIPDAYVGEDGNFYIKFTIEAGQLENLYLAHQILLQDMFITTASSQALSRHGEQYKFPPKAGTVSLGQLMFDGAGGTYVPIGSEAAHDAGGGVPVIYFNTLTDGTIPDTGEPDPPTAVLNATGGNLNGTYEYKFTYVTAAGETLASDESATVVAANQRASISAITAGGTGTIARRLYRAKDGSGIFRRITEIADNVTTTFADNVTDATMNGGALEPSTDTAHRITVDAASQDVGIEGNVAIGTVRVLTNAPADLISVTNPVAFVGASDPEDTEEYRRRLLEFIQSPGTGSPSDLKVIAESINGVESATVFANNPSPGEVTVRISGPGGTIPGAPVIAAVQAALDAYDIADIVITVDTFIVQAQAVTADVLTESGYSLADVTDSATAAITAYIGTLDVGETLRVAGLTDAVFGLAGIADVTITTPASNVTATSTAHKITPGTISVV